MKLKDVLVLVDFIFGMSILSLFMCIFSSPFVLFHYFSGVDVKPVTDLYFSVLLVFTISFSILFYNDEEW